MRNVMRIGRFVDEAGTPHRCRPRLFFVRPPRAPTYTLSLHDALPISRRGAPAYLTRHGRTGDATDLAGDVGAVLNGVGEVRLLGRDQVTKVGLHRGDVGLPLRVGELRDRDGGQIGRAHV